MDNLIQFFQTNVKGEFSLLILALCFLGGVVSSLSPCGIGMLPVVVSYIGASPEQKVSKSAMQIISFIFGLAVSLTAIGVLVKKFPQSNKANAFFYPMLLGMVFAFATTPCSTPILAGIMAAASLSSNIAYAALMLFLFSIGQGMIILVAGLFTSALKNISSFARYSEILTKISGVILVLFSLFLYYKVFSEFIV